MKKKLLILLALCMLAVFVLAFNVSAEDTECVHSYDKWTVELGAEGSITADNITITGKKEEFFANFSDLLDIK